ncbi:hypothetical protein HDV05_004947, partial [Chytridiales sp. JEL 0842]
TVEDLNALHTKIAKLWKQSHYIQKTLMSKFRAATPVNLKHLQLLLQETFERLESALKAYVEQEKEVERKGASLRAGGMLLLAFADLQTHGAVGLNAALDFEGLDGNKEGWAMEACAALNSIIMSVSQPGVPQDWTGYKMNHSEALKQLKNGMNQVLGYQP